MLNDSFLLRYANSPAASLRNANDSFNDSFGDKNTLTTSSLLRALQKEHDQIASALRFQPPTASQYQNSLIELISLFERAEDQLSIGCQKLAISVFLKLSANVLNGLGKRKFQPTLYKLSQIIANSIEKCQEENEIDQENMKKWAERLIIEDSIHLREFPNFEIDFEFNIENVIDELGLSNGRFQFVKSSVFESAKYMASELPRGDIFPESKFTMSNIGDEHFLRLLLWFLIKDEKKTVLNGDFLQSLFSTLKQTPIASEIVQSPCSLLDVKMFLVSLSIVSSTTTDSGMTAKQTPSVAAQLSLTKYQKDCWKAVVENCVGKSPTALSRLRTSQLVDSVRLTSDGSEDVRVLFDVWRHCLQPSAAHDEHVFNAIQKTGEVYKSKMNQLLCFGPFYSADPATFQKTSLGVRRELKTLFPLQFDYGFVDTTEADRIGTVINSLDGYTTEVEPEGNDELQVADDLDDTFHSCATPQFSMSPDNSQFFSPLMNNRHSICPTSAQKLTIPNRSPLSIERLQNVDVKKTSTSSESESEEDELEAALLESTQKHESMILNKQSPRTPMKDAQTDTDDVSSESSFVSVKYTPKREILKKKEDVRVLEEEESEDEEVLSEETEEAMMEQILEATSALFVKRRLAKFGIDSEKINTENTDDEEMMRKAELKLSKISTDLNANLQRLKKLAIPCEVLSSSAPKSSHDTSKCLGCQNDEKQESALRLLEKLALDWDAEGNDYLFANI